jgi:predicted dehydrogenase
MSRAQAQQVVIVGAGKVTASYWLPGAAELGWPVAIVDVMAERAEAVAAQAGRRVRALRSLAEASPGEQDVVVVATPPGAHAAVAREALAAGARRLIIEKPPLISTADLDETMAALRRHRAGV